LATDGDRAGQPQRDEHRRQDRQAAQFPGDVSERRAPEERPGPPSTARSSAAHPTPTAPRPESLAGRAFRRRGPHREEEIHGIAALEIEDERGREHPTPPGGNRAIGGQGRGAGDIQPRRTRRRRRTGRRPAARRVKSRRGGKDDHGRRSQPTSIASSVPAAYRSNLGGSE
jgi:hypothetical protein